MCRGGEFRVRAVGAPPDQQREVVVGVVGG